MTRERIASVALTNGHSSAARPLLSIVIPAHNEADTIGATLGRIEAVAAAEAELAGRVEVIVVSDGSTDDTFTEARAGLDPELPGNVVELAANVGSHAAIRCGLRHATGEYVAIMAADGQDPPEVLPAMLRAFGPQVDVVWGRRRDRANDRFGARGAAGVYYRLFRLLTGLDYPASGLDFVVVRRRVIEAVLGCSGRNTSLFLLIYNLGFAQAFVEYERGARNGGDSSWTLRKRAKLALDMLSSHSAAPIRIATLTGMVACSAGLVIGGVSLVGAAVGGTPASGWAAVMVITALTGGSLLLAIGLLGEFVWRILDEVRGAPPFIEARQQRVPPEADPVNQEER
ncbi:MAG: glycosyltransferase family 2 protein [Thermoleophilaceae bacterium]